MCMDVCIDSLLSLSMSRYLEALDASDHLAEVYLHVLYEGLRTTVV